MNLSIIKRIAVAGILAVSALLAPQAWSFPMSHYAQSSKLAKGNWVKVKIDDSGIYQITDADARNWGFSGGVASLHVFGKGGAPMSETLTTDIPDDLPQVPVVRSNGKLLFYGQGLITWKQVESMSFVQVQHPYATAAYYFVTDSPDYKDIEIDSDNTPVGSASITTFTERLFHEKDLTSPGQLGRNMLGEDLINNTSQAFKFDISGKTPGSKVRVLTTAGVYQASTTGGGNFTFQANGTNLPVENEDKFQYDKTQHLFYTVKTMSKEVTTDADELNYTIKFNNTNATVTLARLDYITVNFEKALTLNNGRRYFASKVSNRAGETWSIAQAGEGTQVWDVTIPHLPVKLNTVTNGSTTTFAAAQRGTREYAAFNTNATYSSPQMVERMVNQDIHSKPVPDMLIITNQKYYTQAQRIADMHTSRDSMRVLVLSQEDIFNEFSSGMPDMMAYRQVCKFFYDHEADGRHHLQYLLLMGNGSYDNKQISAEFKAVAFPTLLTWQSETSNNESGSYCTDDCLAILKDNANNSWSQQQLDIAVGRFPVKSEGEARDAVDKLLKYVTTPSFGNWRNNIVFVADDEEKGIFMHQCEGYIESLRSTDGKNFNTKRIYLDAFEAQSVGASRNYPGARDALYGSLKDGVLMWCYNGHSSPNVVSGHNLVRHNDFLNNMYYNHLPLMIGTTCELGRYDQIEESGAELMFLNKNGGAISVITANRQALRDESPHLANNLLKQLFSRDSDGMPLRLGEAFKNATNANRRTNNLNYSIMGDPAMRLAIPQYTARIEAINGAPVVTDPTQMPVFKARQTITFSGTIVDAKGNKVNNFNGSVLSNLYDCDQSVTTHGYGDGEKFTYQEHSNRIALTNDSVKNGEFSIKVTIPSEIMYSYDNYTPSLINLYAYDAQRGVDAIGASEDFYIYGYDEDIKADTIGPQIFNMGLNSDNFKNGDDVNESPYLIATVGDQSGINLSDAGIGHTMTLILDDETVYTDVNKYYTPMLYKSAYKGSINYPLKNLKNGNHSLKLRVWDVFNNMSEYTITFNVVNGLKPEIYEVYTTANPAKTETTFYVKHNRPDAVLNVGIEVYDLMGKLVWRSQQSGQSEMYTSFPITWNLTDLNGGRVPRGIYVYRATVSTDGVREATKSKKLAVTGE
ncbi:MAG: type IX secretion system sortase PorU [Muribaculaceae bacterium]|nr:type IX secretion system sortase PorU [Muribaculaceae bacterium]